MKLPAYPRTKPSGVAWLGDVPEHWEVKRLRHVLSRNDGGVWGEEDDPEGTVVLRSTEQTVDGGWQIADPARRNLTPKEKSVALLKAGDLVVTKSSGSALHIGKTSLVSKEVEELQPCYSNFMQRLRAAPGFEPRLVFYVLNSPTGRQQLVFNSNTTTGLANLNAGVLGDVFITTPPPTEQRSIAAFLDRETGRVDRLVATQRELIERLKEKRTALISRTVTRGLPPAAARAAGLPAHPPLKPSALDWLGDIPEHWFRTTLKRVVSVCGRIGFRGYTTDDLVDEGDGALALGGANLTDVGRLDLSKRTYLSWPKYEESPEIKVAVNDLVIGQRGTCGNVVLIDREIGPATINPSLVLLKQPKIHGDFLCYWLMGQFIQSIFDSYLSATAVPMLSQQQIGNVPVCHPPLPEQAAIAAYLDVETAKLDALVTQVEAAVERLREYRTALITAAVTGKIDVRNSTKD